MPKRIKLITTLSNIFLSGILIGILGKILHWPFSHRILLISSSFCLLFVALEVIVKPNRKLHDYLKFVVAFLWITTILLDIFKIEWGSKYLKYLFWIGLIAYYISKNNSPEKKKQTLLSTSLFVLTGIFIMTGVLFKIMHWPYAGSILIIGFAIGIIYLFSGVFSKNKSPQDNIDEIGKS